jgi:hypothetical protein
MTALAWTEDDRKEPHMTSALEGFPLPGRGAATVVVSAPGVGHGHWAGAPSAVRTDDGFVLAYRLRRPVQDGRGYSVVLARSSDGERFEQIGGVDRDWFGAASLERPALVRRLDGGWRLYVSCATPKSKHWWVEALDTDDLADLEHAQRHRPWPGSALEAAKDPVVWHDGTQWRAWVCCHPLTDPNATDRMFSRHAVSTDGLHWRWQGPVLRGRPGSWDQRGARVSTVVDTGALRGTQPRSLVFYDGRRTAEQNWAEQTGVVCQVGETLTGRASGPAAVSPHHDGALRYLSAVSLGQGRYRYYYEAAVEDGSHALLSELVRWSGPQRTAPAH